MAAPGSARISIEIDMEPSAVILMRDFNLLSLDVRSFRVPITRAIQRVLAPSFQLNFEVGGRPKWKPLAPATVERKAREGKNPATLIDKGVLKRTSGFLSIWKITQEDAAILGFPDYAFHGYYHQQGTPTIPARPFLVIQPEDEDKVENEFDFWLEERLHYRGFGGLGFTGSVF